MPSINPQAAAANAQIGQANPHVLDMLSARGKGIFFPSQGILAQAADAKGKKINATIGIALEDDGSPLALGCLAERVDLNPKDVFPYAPSFGKAELRDEWLKQIRAKNPGLADAALSRPCVTCALTHALSICGYLFADPGDKIYLPDLFWGNYKLIFSQAYDAELATFNTFKDGGFDVAALRNALMAGPVGKKIVLLNFPNNPTGYTPTEAEVDAIAKTLVAAADAGNDVVALIDDAYFGLVYEPGIATESIFAHLADAHERLLAVKIDGATKEDYVWGLRVGFITYAVKGSTPALFKALEDKTGGAIRGNVSNAPHISQSLVLQAFQSPDYAAQKQEKYETLKRRAVKVRQILDSHPEYAAAFTALPFNSGYFMCLKPTADAEQIRQILLADYSTGIIATTGLVRVAFSSTPYNLLDELFANIYQATLKAKA